MNTMKNLFIAIITSTLLILSSCTQNSEQQAEQTSVDTAATVSIKRTGDFGELFGHYQHLTFALSSDNDKEAVNAAKGLLEVLPTIKTDSFDVDQKKTFDDIAADIKEHAEHITENAGNIVHQREHLVLLSKDFYDIAKTFGTAKPIYKIFCSMYDNNKGAYWISDSKVVKNPYYGSSMLDCGVVEEEIK